MNTENRDRLLRSAWSLSPFEVRVAAVSDIAQRIGPARAGSSSSPVDLPYTLRNLAGAARRVSRARGGGVTTLPPKRMSHVCSLACSTEATGCAT